MDVPAPGPEISSSLSAGTQLSVLMRAKARRGKGSGRGGAGGGGPSAVISPSKTKTSGRIRETFRPIWKPEGSTTLANTVPLARKGVPGTIFMSRIVTFWSIWGRGFIAGRWAGIIVPGNREVEMLIGLGSPERYRVRKAEMVDVPFWWRGRGDPDTWVVMLGYVRGNEATSTSATGMSELLLPGRDIKRGSDGRVASKEGGIGSIAEKFASNLSVLACV
jgi:hypothetical protein